MSNRQAKKARKAAQREGTAAYVHVKPTERVLTPVPKLGGDIRGNRTQQQDRYSRNEQKRRERLYGSVVAGDKEFEYLTSKTIKKEESVD